MSSPRLPWDRLVRFVSQDSQRVLYGQPILADPSDVNKIAELADAGDLKVKVFEGDTALTATPTDKTATVGKLLGPLDGASVPIVRCIGLNYRTHILETGRPLPTCPTIFTKPSPSIADHGEDIPIPTIAQDQCDYEGELVILIGKDAKNVPESEALDYVAAYTAGNDVSARDWQREPNKAGPVPQWTFSKSFDKYAPLGPCLVAAHMLGSADNLSLRTIVNGEVRQDTNTSDLCFGVAKLVAFCSQGQTLQKGSLIMTGTPGGVGLFMKPPAFLKNGDEVVVEVGEIGRLRNRIVFEKG
ncbi:fumarylacetoacetate hydrolase family protein [Aspergillus lucknowensis]|uniref:Fumarylacetoacetase-like C-terminal domain-containing protein n=1 Tax=Aspergillus lucknowensis TaxID=176173 RepID=A0ABR4M3V7_9EURO